jgi:ABC-type transport system involved in multi-copper enzyme maturation permease subunit
MHPGLSPPGTLAVAAILAGREAKARLASPWFWTVASAVCVLAWIYGAGFVASFDTESVLVTTDPLMALNILVVSFLGIVLGLRLAASMAWEREHRTLEVLLVGPAGWIAIVAAKFLVELAVLAILVAIYAAYLLAAQPLGADVIGPHELTGLGAMPLFALPVMALGLLIGAGLATVRGAVVAFLVLVGVLAAFEIARGLLAAQPVEQMSLTGLYLRHALDVAAPAVHLVSAASQLARPVEALLAQAPLHAAETAAALALTLATLAAAMAVGRVRGALA